MEVKELFHISDTESVITKNRVDEDSAEIIVQSQYSLISTGTERIVSTGSVPQNTVAKMRVPYMKGEFAFPVSYGYSLVGKVTKGPEKLKDRFVHLLHPHHNYAFVKEQDVFLIPEAIPPKRAVFASNMETIVNAIWDAKLQLGDSILITGFGTIGALLALTILQFPGIDVKVMDNNEKRRNFAKACGLELIENRNLESEFDICFHCTGNENGLQFCIDNSKTEGTIIELSWYGNKKVNINLGGSFHTGRKKIISSQVSEIPKDKDSSWNFGKRKELVFKLLRNDIYDKIPCLEIPFNESPNFFKRVRTDFINEPGIIIKY